MRTKSKASILTLALVTTALSAPSAWAQESDEIVVTAQRREQQAQDVGIAMTVLSGNEMESLHYTNSSDIVAQAPGVEARRQFPQRGLRSNFFIRGVGSTDFNDATETPVAIYVDDFYMISPSTADFSLMDIARVELLRGPQSTLFGRNSNGGAVQFVTNRPEFDAFSGAVQGTLGSLGTGAVEAILNVPLSDTFAIRGSAQWSTHDFYTENVAFPGRDVGDENYWAGRFQARYQPSANLDILYKYEQGRTYGAYGETDPLVTLAVADGDVIRDPDNTNAYGYNTTLNGTDGPDRTAAEGFTDGSNEIESHLLRSVWDISDQVTFTSITGYMQQDYNVYEDCDGTPSIICNYDGFYESEHFTQEFRLNGETGGLNWTAGLYYLNHDSSGGLAAPLYFTADGNPDPSGVTPGLGFYADFDNHLMAYAAFGQVEFAVTDTVTLIGGLRYSVDDRDFEQTYPVYTIETDNSRFPFDDPSDFLLSSHTVTGLLLEKNFTRATVGDLTNSNRDSVAWTAQVNWTPRDEQLFYASVRRGVKAAGFNNGSIPVFDITLDQYPFDQEVLTAYEIGEKISFADNRARINSAIFYYDYQDYQVIAFKTLGQVQTNADATITGAELELEVSPITGLDLSASVSLLHTEIKGISRGLGLPFVDREMGEAPEVALTALARYEWPAFGGQMSAQLSGNYTGERWTDAQNLTVGRLPAYTVFDAQVEFVTPDANTSILLWARNITDERVPFNTLVTLTGFGIGQQKWNERPVAGLTLRHHF